MGILEIIEGGKSSVNNLRSQFFSPSGNVNAPKFFSPDIPINFDTDIPINLRSDIRAPTYQFAPTDARSVIIVTDSPGATTKKADKISAGATSTPEFDLSPKLEGQADISIIPKIGGSGFGTIALVAGVGIGAWFLLKDDKGGKK